MLFSTPLPGAQSIPVKAGGGGGGGGGEQRGVTTINPSGNPSNRTQDEHPINFFSLKSYLGNWLVRCGVTTM